MNTRRYFSILALAVLVVGGLVLVACDEAEAPESTPGATSTASSDGAETPAIVIDEPGEGATVTSPLTVSGTASVFEATLSVALKDSRGNPLCEIVTTASEGAPGRGDYEVTLPFVPPDAEEDGTVEAFTLSAKDGSVQDLVSVPVTISTDQPKIVVTLPLCGQEVSSPFVVEGTASVFEAALVIVVRDAQGNELASVSALADRAAPERGEFAEEVTFSVDAQQMGTIEAYSGDPRDGSVINLFAVPVILTP